jgi:hypothetical protein
MRPKGVSTMRLKDFVKEAGGTTGNLFNLPVDRFDPNPGNIRLDRQELRDHIRALADDIKTNGSDRTRPRMVGDRAQVQDGNCRLMAVRVAISEGAQIVNLPCIPETDGMSEADSLVRMATRNTSLAHTALEYAVIVKKFQSWGWTDTEIAKRLQKSRQWLANTMDLAGAPIDVREAVAAGTVSPTQAVKLVRSEGANAGAVIAKAKAETGGNHITAKHVQAVAPKTPKPPVIAAVALPAPAPAPPPPITPPPVCDGLATAVRAFLAAWDEPDSGQVTATISALRELVA